MTSPTIVEPGRWYTFARRAGDHARYCFGDGAAAVALAKRSGFVAVDIETSGKDGHDALDLKAVTIGTANRAVVLDPVAHRAAISDAIAAAKTLVFHNSDFDVPALVATGLMSLDAVWKVVDTQTYARLGWPGDARHGRTGASLGAVAERILGAGYRAEKDAMLAGFKGVTNASKSEMFRRLGLTSPGYVAYAGYDVILTSRIYEVLPTAVDEALRDHPFKLDTDTCALMEREQVVTRMCVYLCARGFLLDFDRLDGVRAGLARDTARLASDLYAAGIDVDAGQAKAEAALRRVLHDSGLVGPGWKTLNTGEISLDARYLETCGLPIAATWLEYKQAVKFDKDFAADYLAKSFHGRLHPKLSVLATVGGRMTCSGPNLQQVPPAARPLLRHGRRLTSLDYSSIEPVILAYLAKEDGWLTSWEGGGDVYLPVAEAAGVSRSEAKKILLGLLYGEGKPTLAGQLGISIDQVRALVEKVLGGIPKAKAMIRTVNNIGRNHGLIPTISGRVLPLEKDYRYGDGSTFTGHVGINRLIQGSAYDVLAESLRAVHDAGLAAECFLFVHDEILVSTEAADEVARIMARPPQALADMAGRVPVLRVGRTDFRGANWEGK